MNFYQPPPDRSLIPAERQYVRGEMYPAAIVWLQPLGRHDAGFDAEPPSRIFGGDSSPARLDPVSFPHEVRVEESILPTPAPLTEVIVAINGICDRVDKPPSYDSSLMTPEMFDSLMTPANVESEEWPVLGDVALFSDTLDGILSRSALANGPEVVAMDQHSGAHLVPANAEEPRFDEQATPGSATFDDFDDRQDVSPLEDIVGQSMQELDPYGLVSLTAPIDHTGPPV